MIRKLIVIGCLLFCLPLSATVIKEVEIKVEYRNNITVEDVEYQITVVTKNGIMKVAIYQTFTFGSNTLYVPTKHFDQIIKAYNEILLEIKEK